MTARRTSLAGLKRRTVVQFAAAAPVALVCPHLDPAAPLQRLQHGGQAGAVHAEQLRDPAERRRRAYTPEEIRGRLRDRHAEATASSGSAGRPATEPDETDLPQ